MTQAPAASAAKPPDSETDYLFSHRARTRAWGIGQCRIPSLTPRSDAHRRGWRRNPSPCDHGNGIRRAPRAQFRPVVRSGLRERPGSRARCALVGVSARASTEDTGGGPVARGVVTRGGAAGGAALRPSVGARRVSRRPRSNRPSRRDAARVDALPTGCHIRNTRGRARSDAQRLRDDPQARSTTPHHPRATPWRPSRWPMPTGRLKQARTKMETQPWMHSQQQSLTGPRRSQVRPLEALRPVRPRARHRV